MVNKVILIGNIGADPDVRTLENGSVSSSFSIATDEVYRDSKGERKVLTDWSRVTTRGELAKFVQEKIKKGMKVYVEGKLHTTSKLDETTGKKHYSTIVSAKIVRPVWVNKNPNQEEFTGVNQEQDNHQE